MILACPACSTRYVVPDSAIGVEGRTVRCAKCRHSWFQQGPDLPARPEANGSAVASAEPAAPPSRPRTPQPAATGAEGAADPQDAHLQDNGPQDYGPQDDGQVPEPPVVPRPVPRNKDAAFAETASRFEHEPPFRPRRNMAKLWTIAAGLFALLVVALIGLATWFGLPAWLPSAQSTFGAGQPDLVLAFPAERQDRRTLPNGTEYFGASGTVTNVGKDPRDVPPILIVLRDAKDRVVYTWDVAPPRDSLKPGESVTINEAVTDVPKSARVAEIGWKPE
jgi:predicted Zn finger-like uncharacterized protein